jgi:hypothetical protein
MDKNGDSSIPSSLIGNDSEARWNDELLKWRRITEEIRLADLDNEAKLVRLASELTQQKNSERTR